jgi:uncharacterized membrane protein YfcA
VLTGLVALSVLVGALAQSVSGIGFSLVSGPLLVAALGAAEGVRLSVLLSLALNVVLVVRYRAEVDRRGALLLLVPTALTLPLLAALARRLPARPAEAAAGAVVLLGTLLLASGARWRAARGRAGAVAAGVAAAATTVVASVAGPPVALWAANAGWPAATQRATLQAYFLGVNVVALPALGMPRVALPVVLLCLAALAAGVLAGVPLAARVPARVAERTTLALAGTGGAVVLARALAG